MDPGAKGKKVSEDDPEDDPDGSHTAISYEPKKDYDFVAYHLEKNPSGFRVGATDVFWPQGLASDGPVMLSLVFRRVAMMRPNGKVWEEQITSLKRFPGYEQVIQFRGDFWMTCDPGASHGRIRVPSFRLLPSNMLDTSGLVRFINEDDFVHYCINSMYEFSVEVYRVKEQERLAIWKTPKTFLFKQHAPLNLKLDKMCGTWLHRQEAYRSQCVAFPTLDSFGRPQISAFRMRMLQTRQRAIEKPAIEPRRSTRRRLQETNDVPREMQVDASGPARQTEPPAKIQRVETIGERRVEACTKKSRNTRNVPSTSGETQMMREQRLDISISADLAVHNDNFEQTTRKTKKTTRKSRAQNDVAANVSARTRRATQLRSAQIEFTANANDAVQQEKSENARAGDAAYAFALPEPIEETQSSSAMFDFDDFDLEEEETTQEGDVAVASALDEPTDGLQLNSVLLQPNSAADNDFDLEEAETIRPRDAADSPALSEPGEEVLSSSAMFDFDDVDLEEEETTQTGDVADASALDEPTDGLQLNSVLLQPNSVADNDVDLEEEETTQTGDVADASALDEPTDGLQLNSVLLQPNSAADNDFDLEEAETIRPRDAADFPALSEPGEEVLSSSAMFDFDDVDLEEEETTQTRDVADASALDEPTDGLQLNSVLLQPNSVADNDVDLEEEETTQTGDVADASALDEPTDGLQVNSDFLEPSSVADNDVDLEEEETTQKGDVADTTVSAGSEDAFPSNSALLQPDDAADNVAEPDSPETTQAGDASDLSALPKEDMQSSSAMLDFYSDTNNEIEQDQAEATQKGDVADASALDEPTDGLQLNLALLQPNSVANNDFELEEAETIRLGDAANSPALSEPGEEVLSSSAMFDFDDVDLEEEKTTQTGDVADASALDVPTDGLQLNSDLLEPSSVADNDFDLEEAETTRPGDAADSPALSEPEEDILSSSVMIDFNDVDMEEAETTQTRDVADTTVSAGSEDAFPSNSALLQPDDAADNVAEPDSPETTQAGDASDLSALSKEDSSAMLDFYSDTNNEVEQEQAEATQARDVDAETASVEPTDGLQVNSALLEANSAADNNIKQDSAEIAQAGDDTDRSASLWPKEEVQSSSALPDFYSDPSNDVELATAETAQAGDIADATSGPKEEVEMSSVLLQLNTADNDVVEQDMPENSSKNSPMSAEENSMKADWNTTFFADNERVSATRSLTVSDTTTYSSSRASESLSPKTDTTVQASDLPPEFANDGEPQEMIDPFVSFVPNGNVTKVEKIGGRGKKRGTGRGRGRGRRGYGWGRRCSSVSSTDEKSEKHDRKQRTLTRAEEKPMEKDWNTTSFADDERMSPTRPLTVSDAATSSSSRSSESLSPQTDARVQASDAAPEVANYGEPQETIDPFVSFVPNGNATKVEKIGGRGKKRGTGRGRGRGRRGYGWGRRCSSVSSSDEKSEKHDRKQRTLTRAEEKPMEKDWNTTSFADDERVCPTRPLTVSDAATSSSSRSSESLSPQTDARVQVSDAAPEVANDEEPQETFDPFVSFVPNGNVIKVEKTGGRGKKRGTGRGRGRGRRGNGWGRRCSSVSSTDEKSEKPDRKPRTRRPKIEKATHPLLAVFKPIIEEMKSLLTGMCNGDRRCKRLLESLQDEVSRGVHQDACTIRLELDNLLNAIFTYKTTASVANLAAVRSRFSKRMRETLSQVPLEFLRCSRGENLVFCVDCARPQHTYCILFSEKLHGQYKCSECGGTPLKSLRAREIFPENELSRAMEASLDKEYKIVVRVVYAARKRLVITPPSPLKGVFKGLQLEMDYVEKCILAFQEQEDGDVCVFALRVEEFDDECPFTHRRYIHIAYLDSVRYIEPDNIKTTVYQNCLNSYLHYSRSRGFWTAHIWSYPGESGSGDALTEYVFGHRPPYQRNPNSNHLFDWYKAALMRGGFKMVTGDDPNLIGEGGREVSIFLRFPYFNGGFVADQFKGVNGSDQKNWAAIMEKNIVNAHIFMVQLAEKDAEFRVDSDPLIANELMSDRNNLFRPEFRFDTLQNALYSTMLIIESGISDQ